jgi:twitching motility protein PilT
MVEFFPAVKQPMIRSIMASVLCGVISQRLLPRAYGGRIPAVEVMVVNARIADLIRDSKTDEIGDAIQEGAYFHMQTFTAALIDLVLSGQIDQEVAANASSNRHDFLIALERALKEQAVQAAQDAAENGSTAIAEPALEQSLQRLRVTDTPQP